MGRGVVTIWIVDIIELTAYIIGKEYASVCLVLLLPSLVMIVCGLFDNIF